MPKVASSKVAISVPESVLEQVKARAALEGTPVSHWFTAAALQRLRDISWREAVRSYEEEFGTFTEEEKRRVDAEWQA